MYIFFGSDDFSRQQYVTEFIAQKGLPVVFLVSPSFAELENSLQADLFAGVQTIVVSGAVGTTVTVETVPLLKSSANHIVLVEDALDKRLTLTKQLLKDSDILTKEFAVPEGDQLISWVLERAKERGGHLDSKTAQFFLQFMGIETAPVRGSFTEKAVSLWQIDSELEKVILYAPDKITEQAVRDIVSESVDVQSFAIIDALAEKNKAKTFEVCEQFLADAVGADEKAKLIQLNSLLAEQFRSIVMVQDMMSRKVPEHTIVQQTGWKPGRVFMVKKNAAKFEQKKLLDTLKKLENFDIELKTSQTPAHVLLDLILVQLF